MPSIEKYAERSVVRKPPPSSISAMHSPLPVSPAGNAYAAATCGGVYCDVALARGRKCGRACGRSSSPKTPVTTPSSSEGTKS